MAQYPIQVSPDREVAWALNRYRPWPGQLAFHETKSRTHPWAPIRYRLLCAGSRYGKSRAGGMEALAYLLTPGTRTWIVGPTYDLASREFRYVVDGLQRMRAGGIPIPIARLVDNANAGLMTVTLDFSPDPENPDPDMRSLLQAKSWKEPATLLGEELDLLVLSEGSQCPKSIWERYLRARLGTRLGRVVIPTTPAGVDDFLYPMFYEPWQRGEPDYWVGQYGVWDNPNFDRQEVEDARRSLDPAVFAEQDGGEFVSFQGRIYKSFAIETHVVEPFEIPHDWPRWRAIDYGYEDPFACLWVTMNDEGQLVVYREHYWRRQILSWHVQTILSQSMGPNEVPKEMIQYTVIDPSARGARLETGVSIMMLLAESGLPTIQGVNDLEAGIFRMMEWLKPDPATGNSGLLVTANCANLIHEFQTYRWQEPKPGKEAGIKPEERNNHCCDALRYLVMSRPQRFAKADKMPRFCFRRYRAIDRALSRPQSPIIGQSRDVDRSRPSW